MFTSHHMCIWIHRPLLSFKSTPMQNRLVCWRALNLYSTLPKVGLNADANATKQILSLIHLVRS